MFVETANKEKLVGDIYLGKIAKVMPGIKAAFVDLGLGQDGFLHFSDIGSRFEEYSAMVADEGGGQNEEIEDSEESETEGQESGGNGRNGAKQRQRNRRENGRFRNVLLQKGQDIIVQITKEPVARKGVRVTSEVSLAGRFLVLLPFDDKIGISKKISSFREKRRLRKMAQDLLPEGFGVIIRTVAEGRDDVSLRNDLEGLIKTWREIEQSVKTEKAPCLLYKDMATTSSVIRDLFSQEVERVTVDDRKLFKEITSYIKFTQPQLLEKIELHRERTPIFDRYGIEKELEASLNRKVWLKSGGYIIIEPTEAMVVIDVNSGRYAAKREQEQNSLRTDLEAAREVARQLRLRDIGGIIVVDFIDLDDERNKRKVNDELRKEFRKDRAKITVLPMTEFGLVQITRQRVRQNILHSFTETCPACSGTGLVRSKTTTINQLDRWLRRFKGETREWRIILRVNPELEESLITGTPSRLRKMMLRHFLMIHLETDPSIPLGEFKVFSRKQERDITGQYNQ